MATQFVQETYEATCPACNGEGNMYQYVRQAKGEKGKKTKRVNHGICPICRGARVVLVNRMIEQSNNVPIEIGESNDEK